MTNNCKKNPCKYTHNCACKQKFNDLIKSLEKTKDEINPKKPKKDVNVKSQLETEEEKKK